MAVAAGLEAVVSAEGAAALAEEVVASGVMEAAAAVEAEPVAVGKLSLSSLSINYSQFTNIYILKLGNLPIKITFVTLQ